MMQPDAKRGQRRPAPTEEGLRLRAIVDHMVDGMVIVNRDGELCFVNAAAARLFGRDADELIGEPFGYPVLAGESIEIEVLRRGAPAVDVELRSAAIEWDGGRAVLISLRDVTERKYAEAQARDLARAQAARDAAELAERRYRRLAAAKSALAEDNERLYQQAQQASHAKSEFLAVVSHELRTPLNAIMGYTDLITAGVSGPLTDAQRTQLGRVRASSRHLLEVVDDILSFSRLDAGRERVRSGTADYAIVAGEAAELARPLAYDKGLPLEVSVPPGPCAGVTDSRKLRQILLNLLSNAIKFSEEGPVRLDLEAEDSTIIYRVQDTGIGIAAERLDRIWEPFYQVEHAHTRTAGGTGIGLSVVRRMTELLGGTVDVESTPGQGSTFTVRLPRRVEAATADEG